jgi:hypothetical protein
MPLRRLFLVFALFAACPAAVHAGSDPGKKASVSFHMQVDATENPKMIFQHPMNGQNLQFRRSPEVGTRDVVNYSPFPAEGGDGFGAVFRLKGSAGQRLSAITNASQGRWLAAMVNGRVVDGVLIDKQIQDGVLVIWRGLTLEDIAALDKALKRFGAEGDKKN